MSSRCPRLVRKVMEVSISTAGTDHKPMAGSGRVVVEAVSLRVRLHINLMLVLNAWWHLTHLLITRRTQS